MAEEAGAYQALWRPEELGITKADDLIKPLRDAISLMDADQARFEKHNPPNGWGDYNDLLTFLRAYLAACEASPDAEVSVSR